MPKQQQSIFSWQLVDNEQTWRELTAYSANSSNKPSVRPRHWFLSAAVFALVLVSLLGAHLTIGPESVWHRCSRSSPRRWIPRVGLRPVAPGRTPGGPGPGCTGHLAQSHSHGTCADRREPRVAIHGRCPSGSVSGRHCPRPSARALDRWVGYVEHRFYRETEDGWVRTTPRPAAVGSHALTRDALLSFLLPRAGRSRSERHGRPDRRLLCRSARDFRACRYLMMRRNSPSM